MLWLDPILLSYTCQALYLICLGTSVCLRMVASFFGCRGPCLLSEVVCDGVGWVPVCKGVQSPVQGARVEIIPGFFLCVATDAFGVPCGTLD